MTDSHTTPEAAILVAVDIAKDHNEVLIELRERRDRHRRFRVANTLEEYKRLVAYLRQLDAPALIGFEATGNYHHVGVVSSRSGFRAAVDSHYGASPHSRGDAQLLGQERSEGCASYLAPAQDWSEPDLA
jgi:Transposase